MSVDKSSTLFHDVEQMQDQIAEYYEFSEDKNNLLIAARGIGFEDVIRALKSGQFFEEADHPNQDKYPHQNIYILELNNYVYMVPFVRKDDGVVFLKTIIPSRKLTKKYLTRKDNSA